MTTDTVNTATGPVCPQCHTAHSADAPCAHAARTGRSSGTLLAQAESLFESYLAARLVRARRYLTETKIALLRDPHSREKRETLLRAEAESQALHMQLVEQVRRAAKTRDVAGITSAAAMAAANRPAVSVDATDAFRALQASKAEILSTTNSEAHNGTTIAEPFLSDAALPAAQPSKSRE